MGINHFYILLILLFPPFYMLAQHVKTLNANNTHYSLEMEYPIEAELNRIKGRVIITFD